MGFIYKLVSIKSIYQYFSVLSSYILGANLILKNSKISAMQIKIKFFV